MLFRASVHLSARPPIRSFVCSRDRSLVRMSRPLVRSHVRSRVCSSLARSPVCCTSGRPRVRSSACPFVRAFARSFALPSARLARPPARPLVCSLVRLSARTPVSSRLSSRSLVRPSARSRICPSFVAPLVNLADHAAARSRVCPSNIARIK